MTLALLLGLQAAASPAPPAAPRIAVADFDLARYRPSTQHGDVHSLFACANSSNQEIVVCARRAGPVYPLEEMARIFEAKPLKAETGIGNGATADIHVEDVEFPGAPGLHSHRLTVGIRKSF